MIRYMKIDKTSGESMKNSITKITLSLVLSTVALPAYGMDRSGKDISIKQVVLGLVGLWISKNAYNMYLVQTTRPVEGRVETIEDVSNYNGSVGLDVESVIIRGCSSVNMYVSNPRTKLDAKGVSMMNISKPHTGFSWRYLFFGY